MQIKGTVKKVFFEKDAFLIGKIEVDDTSSLSYKITSKMKDGEITFSGNHVLGTGKIEGLRLSLDGDWVCHKKYGWQLNCHLIELDVTGDMYMFLVNFISGVGDKLAKHMVNHFSNDRLIEMFQSDHKALREVRGVGPVLLKRIVKSWERFSSVRELSAYLAPAGCSSSLIYKVYKHFEEEDDFLKKIKANPYRLTEVRGIGFKKCDELALNAGIDPLSPLRVMAAIVYTLDFIASMGGHTMAQKKEIIDFLVNDLSIKIKDSLWDENFQSLTAQKILVDLGNGHYALKKYHNAEVFIRSFVERRKKQAFPPSVPLSHLDSFISSLENKNGFKYNKEQRQAIIMANTQSLSIVSGIAGAGKTTCSSGILEVLSQTIDSDRFFVTALSGIAADRIRKATGYSGGTIQSLLVKYKNDQFLDHDVLIIDEASMVPSYQLYLLLEKVKPSCRVLLVGDPCQIDPVGPGSPFSDILKYSTISKTILTEPNRQSRKSGIIQVASSIRKGEMPDLSNCGDDFCFIKKFIPNLFALKKTLSDEQMAEKRNELYQGIRDCVSRYFLKIKQYKTKQIESGNFDDYLFGDQVISPLKKKALGSEDFNKVIQNALNENEDFASCSMGGVRLYDKVLHNTNIDMPYMGLEEFKQEKMDYNPNKKTRVFNGFIGAVLDYDDGEKLCWIYFPLDNKVVIYSYNDLASFIELGYALTVHKSQGSEYRNVIIPMSTHFYRMLNTRLLYTAVTRAKKRCTIVGDSYAIKIACGNVDNSQRRTLLSRLLKG